MHTEASAVAVDAAAAQVVASAKDASALPARTTLVDAGYPSLADVSAAQQVVRLRAGLDDEIAAHSFDAASELPPAVLPRFL